MSEQTFEQRLHAFYDLMSKSINDGIEIDLLLPFRELGLLKQEDYLKFLVFLINYHHDHSIKILYFSKQNLIDYIEEYDPEEGLINPTEYFKTLGYDVNNKNDMDLLFNKITKQFIHPFDYLTGLIESESIEHK